MTDFRLKMLIAGNKRIYVLTTDIQRVVLNVHGKIKAKYPDTTEIERFQGKYMFEVSISYREDYHEFESWVKRMITKYSSESKEEYELPDIKMFKGTTLEVQLKYVPMLAEKFGLKKVTEWLDKRYGL